MAKKIPITLFFTLVFTITALFAANETWAQTPDCYQDLANGIDFGNGVCDPGESDNECIEDSTHKLILEICPPPGGTEKVFPYPCTDPWGYTGEAQCYSYVLTNKSARKLTVQHGDFILPKCDRLLDILAMTPANGFSVREPGVGDTNNNLGEGFWQNSILEVNYPGPIGPQDSLYFGFAIATTPFGEGSFAAETGDITMFDGPTICPLCQEDEPTTESIVYSKTLLGPDGESFDCKFRILLRPLRIVLEPGSADCQVFGRKSITNINPGLTKKFGPGEFFEWHESPSCYCYWERGYYVCITCPYPWCTHPCP